jgi:hypothetical protein
VAKILLENDVFEFLPDRKVVSEARLKGTGAFPLPIPGRLSVCDVVNGNKRRYGRTVWEKNVNDPKSPLQEKIARNSAFGLLEHPKDGHVDLNSPISHLVSKVWMEGAEVHGTITVLNTSEGLKLTALIEAGYNPLVSSRGYGSVVKAADGVDDVQDDFVCESWDVVATPSFVTAELNVPREEAKKLKEAVEPKAPALVETAKPAPQKIPETLSVPKNQQSNTKPTMDIKSINESVQALRAQDPSKLEPIRFAEGITRIHQLHRDVAALVAEDTKLAWDGDRLHKDLDSVEKAWAESMQAPTNQVVKLQEQQTRTLRVVKAVAETGLQLKKTLAEVKIKADAAGKKLEETIRRGKGWMERATTAEQKNKLIEHKFDVACTALDLLTERYHADTAALGKRVLTLEFKPTDEKLVSRIKEAKTAKELAAIREELKPKTEKPVVENKPEDKPAAKAEDKPAKTEEKPVVTESKVEAPKVETKVVESKTDESIYVVESALNRPFTIAESVKVGRDLSKTA